MLPVEVTYRKNIVGRSMALEGANIRPCDNDPNLESIDCNVEFSCS